MAPICAGCLKPPTGREFLACSLCSSIYDLACANVSSARFYNTMTADHKTKWKCPACVCNQPKKGNTNTPVRILEHKTDCPKEVQRDNVTMRRKKNTTLEISKHDESTGSDDLSILGDTICQTISSKTEPQTEPTLQTLIHLITEKLKENNTSVITQLQSTIQTEINRAITQFNQHWKQETDNLKQLNIENKTEIEKLKEEIEIIKQENGILKKEIAEIGHKQKTSETTIRNTEENTKKIVIYGMEEFYKEPEYDLHMRIIDIFRSTLNLDLLGYIEETRRIGKYQNKNRPLIVELISKRMVKYLLDNSHHFQGTGIAISPLLDEKKRNERRLLREEMIKARKTGLHATIRDNQLYIQGKQIQLNNNNTDKNITCTYSEPENRAYNKYKYDDHNNEINNTIGSSFRYYRQHKTL